MALLTDEEAFGSTPNTPAPTKLLSDEELFGKPPPAGEPKQLLSDAEVQATPPSAMDTSGAAFAPNRVVGAAIQGAKEGLQTDVPLLSPEDKASLAQVPPIPIPGIPFANLRTALTATGLGVEGVNRAFGALASGGAEAFHQSLVELGVPDSTATTLTQDATTLMMGESGRVAGEAAGLPKGPNLRQVVQGTDINAFAQEAYRRQNQEANKIGPEGQLPGPGGAVPPTGPVAPTGSPPAAPPPSPVGPFPNAATDGFDFKNFEFAEEPPSAPVVPFEQPKAPTAQGPFPVSGEPPVPEAAKPPEQVAAENPPPPPAPPKPVISGDIEKFQTVLEGTIGKDKLAKILKAAGITPKEALESIARQNNSLELAADSLHKAIQDRDAMSPREKQIADQQKEALTREFQDRVSKLKIDAAKARNDKAGLSAAEKYALAVEEQKAKGAEAAKVPPKKPSPFQVIQGGLPPKKPFNPLAMAVPHLPPVDAGTLPTVSPSEAAGLASDPTTAATFAALDSGKEPDLTIHHALLLPKDDLSTLSTVTFGSPADLERQLAVHGTKNVRIVAGRKGDFPIGDTSALLSDLPLGAHEADRVTGDAAARVELRAAVDLYKMHQGGAIVGAENRFLAPTEVLNDLHSRAFDHYINFLKAGGRVVPSRGQGFLLFKPGEHAGKFVDVPTTRVPRTSRTRATLWRAPDLERIGFYLFSQGRVSNETRGVSIDLTRIKNKEDITALPAAAAKVLMDKGINPLDATEQDFADAGVYFLTKPNMGLLEDVQRQIWKYTIYGGDYAGAMSDFANLAKRGMRIRVTPETSVFMVLKEDAEQAIIPGVNLSRRGSVPEVGDYGATLVKDRLTVGVSPAGSTIAPISAADRVVLRRYAKLTKVILRKLGIKVDLLIQPGSDEMLDTGTGPRGVNRASFDIGEDGQAVITLHLGRHYAGGQLDQMSLLSSYGHEVGHLIAEYSWKELPFDVQDQLLAAHDRTQLGLASHSYQAALAQSGSLYDFATPGANINAQREYIEYYGGFHEFLARQVERHMMNELQYGGPAGRFFSTLTGRIRLMFREMAAYDANFFEPPLAVKEWISHLAGNPVRNSHLGETMNGKMKESMSKSGQLALPGVEHPTSAQTVNIRIGLNKVWGPRGPGPEFDGDALLRGANWLSWLFRHELSIPDLIGHNSHIPGALSYADTLRVWNNYESEQNAFRVEPRLKAWHALGPTRADKVGEFIFYITDQEYRTPFEKSSGVSRRPYKAEMAAAMQRFGMDYDMLQVFDGVAGDMKDFLLRNGEVWADEARRAYTDRRTGRITNPVALQKELDAIDADVTQMLKAPYFPHTRFGTYAIDVKDSAGNRVAFQLFETAKERDAAGPAMRTRYPRPQYTIDANMTMDDQLKPFVGMPSRLLETVRDRLDLAKYPELREQFEALMFNLGPTQSFRKHLLGRKGTKGYSRNAPRVYADYMLHGNKMLGRAKFRWLAQEQVNKIFDYASRMRNKDKTIRLGRYLQDNLEAMINPANDYVWLRSATFLWMLGGVVKTAAMNLTQMPLTVFPHLSMVYGLQGPKEVTKAIATTAKNWNQILSNPNFREDPLMQSSRMQAYKEGTLRDGMAAEVANVASNRQFAKYNGDNVLKRKAYNMMYGLGVMFSWTESFGRHVAFEAARRLALKGLNPTHVDKIVAENQEHYTRLQTDMNLSWTDQQIRAHLAATHAVRTTYFDTGAWARPKMLRGAYGVVPFTFFTFFRAMLHYQLTQPGGYLSLLIGALLYGYTGLPGAEDINNLIKQIAGWAFGKDLDLDREVRSFLLTVFGKDSDLPELIAHGISSQGFAFPALAHKMGLAAPNFDTSGSLSEGRIIPGVANMDLRTHSKGFAEGVGTMLLESTGATTQAAGRFLQAIAQPSSLLHDPKQIEPMLPNMLKFPLRAARHAITGKEVGKGGATVTTFDMSNWNDRLTLAFEAMGFPPAKLNQEQRVERSQIEAENFWKGQRVILDASLQQALESRDGEAMIKARKDIVDFNARVSNLGMKPYVIKLENRIQAYKQSLIKRGYLERGLAPNKMDFPSAAQTRSIFGTGTVIDKKTVK